tara:strand:+ start:3975 stop:4880 length:906 start_codon:yes stop_codon:yes gene_type:complete
MKIQKNKNITNLTTLRIKSKADFYLKAESVNHIKYGIKFAKEKKIKFFILGNGSNVLFKNDYYKGLIIHIISNNLKLENNILQAGAGVKLPVLSSFCVKNKITGFEYLTHIPGTIGGAICMNAGAFGSSISDNLIKIKVLNAKTEKIISINKSELDFKYKYSIFQNKSELIILRACFKIKKETLEKIQEKTKEYLEHRKARQPFGKPTLGCTFKNLVISKACNFRSAQIINNKKKSAGEFLDKAGCKNIKSGDAEVSNLHANFIINRGNAKSCDILKLVEIMKKKVKNKFNIDLELEIRVV